MPPSRLYLDNAATSFPKPACVHEAMMHYMTRVGGTAGRGNYAEAREGARIIRACRRRLCTLFNGESPDHVVFTLNTSDALNLAINGVIAQRRLDRPSGKVHVVATEADHNSVLRPLNAWGDEGVEWTCVTMDPATGVVDPSDVAAAIRPDTVLVATPHASNVTGAIQPVAELGRLCAARGVPLLVDAAQSLGHIPVDVREMGIDLLAFPGHKGLLGPLGTGGLYIRPGLERFVRPARVGGTGSSSEQDRQPETMPDRYEPGSQNGVGIAGLSEAVQWILDRSDPACADNIYAHDRALRAAMLDGLRSLDAFGPGAGRGGRQGVRLLGPTDPDRRVGVFSLTFDGFTPHEAAGLLEQEYGILARAGLHCAPRVHAALGTTGDGGALRLSTGPFNTLADIERAISALREICEAAGGASDAAGRKQAAGI